MAVLRNGYTTGACVAAGVKAALLYNLGKTVDVVEIVALDGTKLKIPIQAIKKSNDTVCVEVIKFSGDDPDITNGVSIFTSVKMLNSGAGITYIAGEGVGTVTKPGLAVKIGEPAINPGPRQLIASVVRDLLGDEFSLEITIAIPKGKELAKKTLNPVLGITGGISIIGTTGVLRPMSEEAFKNSLVPQIDVAKSTGFENLIFVPGKIGERIALKWQLPAAAMIQTSNFIGFMLENAAKRHIKNILLFGHIGKLSKVAAGVFYTHNRIADARLETLAAYGAACGLERQFVQAILNANTAEDALSILRKTDKLTVVCNTIANRASIRAERYVFGEVGIGTVMVDLEGNLLGLDDKAKEIGEKYKWKMPSIAIK